MNMSKVKKNGPALGEFFYLLSFEWESMTGIFCLIFRSDLDGKSSHGIINVDDMGKIYKLFIIHNDYL
jgi:hypothetical protein